MIAPVAAAELRKQAGRPRTWVTAAALAGFAAALTVAIVLTGADRPEPVGDVPLLIVPASSGLTMPVLALSSTMKFFLPLAVAIFAGDAVAGEARWGSLRTTLTRGVSRTRLLAAKAAVAALFSLATVALVPLAALAAGVLAFGWHPLTAVNGGAATPLHQALATFDPLEAARRLALGTAYVGAGMVSIFAFSLFLSTVTSRTIVAVAGGVALTIVSRVLNADYLPGVAVLSPYLPNNDVDLWMGLLLQPARTDAMAAFLWLQVAYGVVFGGLAWAWFARKDVLT